MTAGQAQCGGAFAPRSRPIQNAQLHLGAGTAAELERRDADAKDALERALTLDPTLTDARALLGQVRIASAMCRPDLALDSSCAPRRSQSVRAPRSNAGGARRSCTTACSRRSARTSRSRSKGRRKTRLPRGARVTRSRVLAHRRGSGFFPQRPDSSRPLHDGAVPRHHAFALVGGGRVRRNDSRADARRARQRRRARSRARARIHSRAGPHAGAAATSRSRSTKGSRRRSNAAILPGRRP